MTLKTPVLCNTTEFFKVPWSTSHFMVQYKIKYTIVNINITIIKYNALYNIICHFNTILSKKGLPMFYLHLCSKCLFLHRLKKQLWSLDTKKNSGKREIPQK